MCLLQVPLERLGPIFDQEVRAVALACVGEKHHRLLQQGESVLAATATVGVDNLDNVRDLLREDRTVS